MKKIRLLQVVPSFSVGGAERLVVHLMTSMDSHKFDVAALSLYGRQGTDLERMLAERNIDVKYLDKKSGPDARVAVQVYRTIRTLKPDLIHTHLQAFNYTLPAIATRLVSHAVHTVHSVAERERKRIGKCIPKALFTRMVKPVAIASEVQQSIRRVYGVDSVLIPNGIPVLAYRSSPNGRAEWRRREGFGPGDVIFVSVGRLDPVKNHRALLDAFALALRSVPNAYLLLAGDGIERESLSAQVEALKLQTRVRFLGIRTDIPAVLGGSDVFVFASDFEGSPLSLMEAMAAGLPVIGTAVGGVPEMVPDGAGLLVSPRSTQALASQIRKIYLEKDTRARMSRAATEHAVRFDVSQMARAYEDLYEAICAPNPFSPLPRHSLANC